MSHGVHRGVLKKGKNDKREFFLKKLIKIADENIKFDLYHHNWKYENGYNEYTKDTSLSNSLNINRIASKVTWDKKLFGFSTKLMTYKSLNKDFSTDAFTINLSRKIFEDFNLEAS